MQNKTEGISDESENSDPFLKEHLFALSTKTTDQHRENLLAKEERWKAFKPFNIPKIL